MRPGCPRFMLLHPSSTLHTGHVFPELWLLAFGCEHAESNQSCNSFHQTWFSLSQVLIIYLNRQDRMRHCNAMRGSMSSDHYHNFLLHMYTRKSKFHVGNTARDCPWSLAIEGILAGAVLLLADTAHRMIISNHCHNVG